MGKWWEADGVGKSLSNPKDSHLDSKLRYILPLLIFGIGNTIVNTTYELNYCTVIVKALIGVVLSPIFSGFWHHGPVCGKEGAARVTGRKRPRPNYRGGLGPSID